MANKWFTKSLALGLAGLALAGCGANQNSSNGGSSESKKEFTLYSNKSEIQEALTAYAKEWGEKNGVTVNIKTVLVH